MSLARQAAYASAYFLIVSVTNFLSDLFPAVKAGVYMNSGLPRILFVDDHQDTLDFFVMALTQENYEVVTATSIERALEQTKVPTF